MDYAITQYDTTSLLLRPRSPIDVKISGGLSRSQTICPTLVSPLQSRQPFYAGKGGRMLTGSSTGASGTDMPK